MIAPNVTVGYAPEGRVTVTTLLIDSDYLIEHLFWQHLDVIPDRDAARDLAGGLYPDTAQVLRLDGGVSENRSNARVRPYFRPVPHDAAAS